MQPLLALGTGPFPTKRSERVKFNRKRLYMAEECYENYSASASNCWWDLHAISNCSTLSPWTNNSCEEDLSVSSTCSINASNHISSSTLTADRILVARSAPSSNPLIMMESDEHASHNQLCTHLLSQDIGESILDALSSKTMTSSMFEPDINDNLKKLSSTTFTSFEKHLNRFSDEIVENERRLNNLSNLASTCSIAPPDPIVNGHFNPQIHNKQLPFGDSSSCSVGFPYYGMDMKVNQKYYASEVGYKYGFNNDNLFVGDRGKLSYGKPKKFPGTRKISDVSCLGRPIVGIHTPIPSLTLSTSNNQREVVRASEVKKKKRSQDSSEVAILKKPKKDTSTDYCTKAPKVKLGDRITALQQIVSPFGKTDTASVLFEAIGYIKFLQEQVQLLSDPYSKTNPYKEYQWENFDREEKGDIKLDLRSRGLCVVPISCTPQVYRDISGPDFLTYRGSLYR